MVEAADDGDYVYLRFPSIHPYKYSMGYSFRAPLPEFRNLFTRVPEEKEEEDETKTPSEEQPSGGPEVVLNASIAGQLQRPKQPMKFVYEDGTEETKQVGSRACLSGKRLLIICRLLCR